MEPKDKLDTVDELPRGRDPSNAVGRNIEPFLLLELLREPSYGYELIRKVADYGFRRATREPAVVYKVLRSLEDSGCIQSNWSTQESGPARRYYQITETGRATLDQRVYQLRRYVDRMERLLETYDEVDPTNGSGHNGTSPPPQLSPSRGEGADSPPPQLSTLDGEGNGLPSPTHAGGKD